MKLDDKTRAQITEKLIAYARGTTESFLGDVGDGYLCLIQATFALHASAFAGQGKPLEEGLVDMTQHMAALYPKIYRVAEETMRKIAGQA